MGLVFWLVFSLEFWADMKARIFRGAIRPPMLLGMPFFFGLAWALTGFLAILYSLVFFNNHLKLMAVSLFILLFLYGTIFFLVRGMTKKDAYKLHQTKLYLMLYLEQNHFNGEFRFVPYSSKRIK